MAADSRTPGPANRPFERLARRWPARPKPPARPAEPAPPALSPPDDADLFTRAMDGVAPLTPERRTRVAGPPPVEHVSRVRADDDAEALAILSGLVAGEVRFDVSPPAEYVEGAVVGLDARLIRRLRRGDFARQAHLDLHGLTAASARAAVRRFLEESLRVDRRCVLLVHGRGRNSKDGDPVLKRELVAWLSKGAMGRMVLAFCSARPSDGGTGALYVLLRRDRRKRPVRVTHDAGG